jgi:hypothetical protein
MKTVDIRIKRPRTPGRSSTWEALERWASLEGRTLPNALQFILETHSGPFLAYLKEIRNPGRETT